MLQFCMGEKQCFDALRIEMNLYLIVLRCVVVIGADNCPCSEYAVTHSVACFPIGAKRSSRGTRSYRSNLLYRRSRSFSKAVFQSEGRSFRRLRRP